MARKRAERTIVAAEPDELLGSLETEATDDEEVTNAVDVPLFSGAGYANNRSIAKLRLVKLDNPGAGYKGEIPTTSTLETIGQIYGDGIYNIEAVNAKGLRLRVLENQRISLGLGPMDGSRPAPAPPATGNAELDRIERLAISTAQAREQQATQYTRMVSETVQSAADREREFMRGQAESNNNFLTAILTAQQQGFQQLMLMMQTGHTHMIESLAATRGNRGDGEESGMRQLQVFMQGMQLGRGIEAPDEQPFWQEILRGGLQVLGGARQAQAVTAPMRQLPKKGGAAKQKLARVMLAMRKRGIDIDTLADMLENGERTTPEADEAEPSDSGEESDEQPRGLVFTGEGDSPSDSD